jgi:hypothetical protein
VLSPDVFALTVKGLGCSVATSLYQTSLRESGNIGELTTHSPRKIFGYAVVVSGNSGLSQPIKF